MAERFELTVESVRERCRPPRPGDVTRSGRPITQRIYWDTAVPGFGVMVGKRAKTYFLQRDLRGETVRVKIGRHPTWTATQARRRARELAVEMDKGVNPNAAARAAAAAQRRRAWQAYTLAQAVEEHVARMRTKECVERSMQTVRDLIGRYMADWTSRPLCGVTAADCVARHRRVSQDHGKVAANGALRMLRAVYNSARRMHPELPPNPVEAVEFNPQRRRRSPIPWAELPGWWAKVQAMDNPVRRDLQVLVLLTGLRSADARTIRWEEVDFDRGTLHRPRPKGGHDRAFTVPLCKDALAMLSRRRLDNLRYFASDEGWAFPTRNRRGEVVPVQEPKEQRYERGLDGKVVRRDGKRRKTVYLPSPHRLRDTFATACREAGVGLLETKALMNHALPTGDVTEGYQRPSLEHLRGCVERVAGFLLRRAMADRASNRAADAATA